MTFSTHAREIRFQYATFQKAESMEVGVASLKLLR